MIYPENFEYKIGVNTIRELIKEKCLSSLGIEKVDSMQFLTDYNAISIFLNQTYELLQIINNKELFPTDYFYDIRSSLNQISIDPNYWLPEKEIPKLANSLSTIIEIVMFFGKTKSEIGEIKYPSLKLLADNVKLFPNEIERANSILDKFGNIKDQASKLLADIRKNKIEANKDITRNMQTAIRNAQSQGLVSRDVQPNIRGGYYLLPVNAANKRKIKGIIRDDSGSGKTVFIEPEAVAEAANRLRALEADERKEIARILIEFTNSLRPNLDVLQQSYDFLGTIDFIRAKALFASRINGVKPIFENAQRIEWCKAIHPLLNISLRQDNKQAHPLDIILTPKDRILIISGVNAGGKSLSLKTVALLQYMLQCGMLIPVSEDSRAGIFERIFIDIGDGQSIENSLSTYTSHLTNMKFFVENNNGKSLLLIDEFGGGTEPQIGGAIAETLLDRFNKKKSFGVITSHFQNLKDFAYKTDGVINGAMLYDAINDKPLYKLSIGSPGSSFAIEVARRIGLPDEIIQASTNKLGEDFINMDSFLQSITKDKLYWESKRKEVEKSTTNLEKSKSILVDEKKENKNNNQIKKGDKVSLKGQRITGDVIEVKGEQAIIVFGSIKSKVALNDLELVKS